MPDLDAMQIRHESHFAKIFDTIDDFRNNYVRSPTFVVTLVSCIITIAALTGWIFTMAFADINKNEQSIVDIAIKQGRILERQDSLEREQRNTITQLINALKPSKGTM